MQIFFSEYEEIERAVLKQKSKETKETQNKHTTSLTPKQKSQAQLQANIQTNEQMQKATNNKDKESPATSVDQDFILDLKQRIDYTRDDNLLSSFKYYLEARTTLKEAKHTIDPKLADLKEVVNAFLRSY